MLLYIRQFHLRDRSRGSVRISEGRLSSSLTAIRSSGNFLGKGQGHHGKKEKKKKNTGEKVAKLTVLLIQDTKASMMVQKVWVPHPQSSDLYLHVCSTAPSNLDTCMVPFTPIFFRLFCCIFFSFFSFLAFERERERTCANQQEWEIVGVRQRKGRAGERES